MLFSPTCPPPNGVFIFQCFMINFPIFFLFSSGLGPIKKVLKKINQNLGKILRFLKSSHIKIPCKNPLSFVQLASPKFIRKFVRFSREKLYNSNSEEFFWEFVDRANFLTKNWEFWCSYLDKILMIFSKEQIFRIWKFGQNSMKCFPKPNSPAFLFLSCWARMPRYVGL